MNRLAIFDCDGTLVDSGATIHREVVETLNHHGLVAPPPSESRRVIGLSLTEAMQVLVPDATGPETALLVETYKSKFSQARREGRVEEPLFEGIPELLDALETGGWLLAVATGKSDRGLKHCLENHGLAGRFISLLTADRHPSKPHPSMALQAMADTGAVPESTIVIGDTTFDMGMARAARTSGIGAGWGYHDALELTEGRAFAVADSPADVLQLLAEGVGEVDG